MKASLLLGIIFHVTYTILRGYLDGLNGKENACNAGDLVQSMVWEDPLEEVYDNPLQCSCLENPHGQRCLVGYSPWGGKELDTTEW